MRYPVLKPSAMLSMGLAGAIALSSVGCDGGASGTTTVQVSPETQKQTDDYLKNYQKQMFEKYKSKPKTKKAN